MKNLIKVYLVAFAFSATAFDADTIAFYPLNEGTPGESMVGQSVAFNYIDSSSCPVDATTTTYADYTGSVLWDSDRPGKYVFDRLYAPEQYPVAVYTNPASANITGPSAKIEAGGFLTFNGLAGQFNKAIAENGQATLEFFWRIPDGETPRTWARAAMIYGSYMNSDVQYDSIALAFPLDATDTTANNRDKQVRISYISSPWGYPATTAENHVGEWVHLAVVYTNGGFYVYNNYEASSVKLACTMANPENPGDFAFKFGCGKNDATSSNEGYRGKISCVRVTGRALDIKDFLRCSDVEHYYDQYAVPQAAAMDEHVMAFYPFDGRDAGSSVKDVPICSAVAPEKHIGILSNLRSGATVTFDADRPGTYIFTNSAVGAVAVYTNPASIKFSGVPNESGMKGLSGNLAFSDIMTELSQKSEGTVELFWKVCETNTNPSWQNVLPWNTEPLGCAGAFGVSLPLEAGNRTSDYSRTVRMMDYGEASASSRRVNYLYPGYLTDGLWHHVAMTYSNGYYRLYCDYTYAGVTSAQMLHTPQTTSKPLDFGNNCYNGFVSCIRVSDKALGPTEMLRASNCAGYIPESDVVFHWRFNNGAPGSNVSSITNDADISFNNFNPQLYLRLGANGTVSKSGDNTYPVYVQDKWKKLVLDGENGSVMTNLGSVHLVADTIKQGSSGSYSFNSGPGLDSQKEHLVNGSFTAELFAKVDYEAFCEHVTDIFPNRPRATLMVHTIKNTNNGAWNLFLNSLTSTPVVTLCLDTSGNASDFTNLFGRVGVPLRTGWHHYAVVYDAENLLVNLYVDWKCVDSATLPRPLRTDEGEKYAIGHLGNNNAFDGWIDEVRVTKAVLPPSRFLLPRQSLAGLAIQFK